MRRRGRVVDDDQALGTAMLSASTEHSVAGRQACQTVATSRQVAHGRARRRSGDDDRGVVAVSAADARGRRLA